MALMSRITQSIHLCFGFPLFLLPGGTISRVFLPTYSWSRLFTWPNHISLAFLHLSVMFSTFSFFLLSSFLTWSLNVWPHAHLHIFISVERGSSVIECRTRSQVSPGSNPSFLPFPRLGIFVLSIDLFTQLYK